MPSFPPKPEDADEEAEENGLEPAGGEEGAGDHPARRARIAQPDPVLHAPLVDRDGEQAAADDEGQRAEDQAAFQVDETEQAEEFWSLRKQALCGREGFG